MLGTGRIQDRSGWRRGLKEPENRHRPTHFER
jgi:hypothetical protein